MDLDHGGKTLMHSKLSAQLSPDCKTHDRHETRTVDTLLGKMEVFEWDLYEHDPLYCTGKDDISRTLINEGVWEKAEIGQVQAVIAGGDRNKWCLDFGSHIGWYTRLLNIAGYKVEGYDCDPENIRLFQANCPGMKATEVWIDEGFKLPPYRDIEFVKIDVEGNEIYVIEALKPLLSKGRIETIFMEVSPTFNDTYRPMVEEICAYGYDGVIDGLPWRDVFDDNPQSNIMLRKS